MEQTETCTDINACRQRILPIRDALDVVNGKWKIPIIVALRLGNKRFREMARSIPNITDKMLSKELRDLEMHGLIARTVQETPPVVEYSLTPYGASLHKVIDALYEWGTNHRRKMMHHEDTEIVS